MSTYKRTINKFNRGEVDERFLARDDVERVVDTCAQLENMMPIRLGPAQYRPGTQFLGSAYVAASTFEMEFLAPNNNSLLLEFFQTTANPSVDGFRIWKDGALVAVTGTTNTIANGSFTSNITSWTNTSDAGGVIAWDASGAISIHGDGADKHGAAYQTLTTTAAAKR